MVISNYIYSGTHRDENYFVVCAFVSININYHRLISENPLPKSCKLYTVNISDCFVFEF